MKKILMSILAIALTVGAVSGTAYALFSSTVSVAGITMTSGNADLKIADTGTNWPVSSSTYVSFLSTQLSNFYPGKIDGTWMNFTNQSKSDIGLDLSAQITNVGTGNWSDLYNKIQLAIVDKSFTVANPPLADFHDLNYWLTNNTFAMNLAHGATEEYRVFIRVKDTVGNEVLGKSLTGLEITFTGTQHQ